MQNTVTIGKQAEQYAYQLLLQQGLQIIEQNWYCRQGEIDLIAQTNDTLIFIEVRYRTRSDYGNGAESVHYHKRRKIISCARYYIHTHPAVEKCMIRFDVFSMSRDSAGEFSSHWIQDAFQT
ncbi:MAG: YraN family protein [Gammaproteobacteria bacterium]|nr:YraN family protein [Gammaproteobacteria bacterium]